MNYSRDFKRRMDEENFTNEKGIIISAILTVMLFIIILSI